ncbi:unnamed protein product [Polarella glacialis]|uniref:Uncharacterized protein n=1 Tax=Polarella glacialis TaxID=89957 RepID=A0A813ES53_POLGL|nr:unnamed protein product [Polarella glacialis]
MCVALARWVLVLVLVCLVHVSADGSQDYLPDEKTSLYRNTFGQLAAVAERQQTIIEQQEGVILQLEEEFEAFKSQFEILKKRKEQRRIQLLALYKKSTWQIACRDARKGRPRKWWK